MENSSDKSTTNQELALTDEQILNTPDDILLPNGLMRKSVVQLKKRIEALETATQNQNLMIAELLTRAPKRAAWEDQITESGIQLGATKVKRTGTIIGAFGIPMSAQHLALMFVVCRDGDNQSVVVNAQDLKYL